MNNQNYCEELYRILSELQVQLDQLANRMGWADQNIRDIEMTIQWKLQELEELKNRRQEHYHERESIVQNINAVEQNIQRIRDDLYFGNC